MISFLQPLALIALGLAAVPPLLHLMARRTPPVIPFPPLRYLTETERRHSRKLKLRHLLLMILRTLIIAAIALAASRPIARVPFGGDHEPAALALVVDNSMSSGAVVDGRRVLDELVDRARRVVDRTDPDDRLWLLLADGIPRRMSAPDAGALLDTLTPRDVFLDLSAAVRTLAATMEGEDTATREIVVVSDLQRTALSSTGTANARVLLFEPPRSVDENRAIDSAWAVPEVWAPEGQIMGAIGGFGGTPTTVQLSGVDGRMSRSFGGVGDVVILDGAPSQGWHRATIGLDPDELRADDEWNLAVRVAPPAAVRVLPTAGSFVSEAVQVLTAGGRVVEGNEVVIADAPVSGSVIVFPPEDPALLGATNRQLSDRGISWQFGDLQDGEWPLDSAWATTSGETVFRRRVLEGSGGVIATAGGTPWIVRDGDVTIVGSRLHPRWTNLPITAAFIPFVDRLVNRVAAHQMSIARGAPGEPVRVPETVASMIGADGSVTTLDGGVITAPFEPGVYFFRGQAGDTVGALEVNHDPRESVLEPAPEELIQSVLGEGSMLLGGTGVDRELFAGARRADLTGALVLMALLLAVAELVIATVGGGRAVEG